MSIEAVAVLSLPHARRSSTNQPHQQSSPEFHRLLAQISRARHLASPLLFLRFRTRPLPSSCSVLLYHLLDISAHRTRSLASSLPSRLTVRLQCAFWRTVGELNKQPQPSVLPSSAENVALSQLITAQLCLVIANVQVVLSRGNYS